MNCDKFSQYIDDLVDGELDQRLKAECEEHIQSCPSCKQIYDNYMFMITSLNEFGDLENSDIQFPEDLHSNIMASVNKAATESNIINILQSNINSENIVDINETSSDNVIDITKEITKEINKDSKETTGSKVSFYKRYGNSLVAGFVTVFVAAGSYQTYQYLRSPSVLQTPMLTIDAGSTEAEYTSQDLNNIENSAEAPELKANVLSESIDPNTTVSSKPNFEEKSQTTYGTGSNSVAPDYATTVPNETPVITSNQVPSTDGKLSTSSDQSGIASTVPQAAPVAAPSPRSSKLSDTPEFKISINSDDLGAYVEYLCSSPDFLVYNSSPTNGTIKVSGSSKNFEKFIEFAKQYSDIENPNINIEYSEETLAKIKETGQFNFTIQQN